MSTDGAWGARAPTARARNPFEEDNPFAPSPSPEHVVESVLQQHYTSEGRPFAGSPVTSSASVAATPTPQRQSTSLQDVPLFDSAQRSSSTRYGTSGGIVSNGSKGAFNVASASPAPSKKSSGLTKLWSGTGNVTVPVQPTGDIQRREADLQRREADLQRREASLAAAGAARKNWPRFMPLVHHDIDGDIPADRRRLVRTAYFAWCLVAAGYIWNFICITAFFIGGQKKVSLWVMAGLVAVAGLPLSFLCWSRGRYWAAARDTGIRWFLYIFHMGAHIVWCWWMFVGINPDIGGYSAGLFTMISQFSDGGGRGIVFGIMCIINMVLFAVCGVISMGVFSRSLIVFRSGPSLPSNRVRM